MSVTDFTLHGLSPRRRGQVVVGVQVSGLLNGASYKDGELSAGGGVAGVPNFEDHHLDRCPVCCWQDSTDCSPYLSPRSTTPSSLGASGSYTFLPQLVPRSYSRCFLAHASQSVLPFLVALPHRLHSPAALRRR